MAENETPAASRRRLLSTGVRAALFGAAASLALGAALGFVDYLRSIPAMNWAGMAIGVALAVILNRLEDLRAELRAIRAAVEQLGVRR